jgi:hypothetical protein
LFVAVLDAYAYKMSPDQKQWWANLIENAQAANCEQCEDCGRFRSQIATHNFETAAADRAGRKGVCNAEKALKRVVVKSLLEHLSDEKHDTFRLPILSEALEEHRELDFTTSSRDEAASGRPSNTVTRAPEVAPSPPRPVAVEVTDRPQRDPDPWPCFQGRKRPLVSQGTQLPTRLRKDHPPIKVGDFVVLRVETDDWWSLPWQVGKVLVIDQPAEVIRVRLHGNHGAKPHGIWYPGWWHHLAQDAQAPVKVTKRRKRRRTGATTRKKQKKGQVETDYPHYSVKKPRGPWTPNVVTAGPDSIIDWGFELRKKGELRKNVLQVIDHNPRVEWHLEPT